MNPRRQRLLLIFAGMGVLGLIAALVLNALRSNLVFFFSPSQVVAGEAPGGGTFRLGGLVKEKTLRREADGVTISFVITDRAHDVPVRYQGILPDLFREGKGAVIQGQLDGGVLVASEVLAKHDENYTPPEAAQIMGGGQMPREKAGQTLPSVMSP